MTVHLVDFLLLANERRYATLEAVGVEFIDEKGGGPGVRLRAPVHGDQGFRLKATTVSGG